MNELSNALLLALLRIGLLLQVGFFRSASAVIRFISAHKSLVFVTWFVIRLGPAIVLGVLVGLIVRELTRWWFGW